jgi:OOP family OmpA-OmpF porin
LNIVERRHTISPVDTAKLTLSALLAACCTGGLAQSGTGWYLGTGLVAPKPRPDLKIPPLPGEPREAAEPYAQQFGGYRFTRHWSVDFGYAGSAQSNAWTLAGSGLLPIGRSFSLRGRLGLAVPTAEFSVSSAAGAFSSLAGMDSRVRSNLLWGFGGEYEINRNVGLRMDYNSRYGEDAAYNRARTDLWSINAVVRF